MSRLGHCSSMKLDFRLPRAKPCPGVQSWAVLPCLLPLGPSHCEEPTVALQNLPAETRGHLTSLGRGPEQLLS